jgi:hypothetical protein
MLGTTIVRAVRTPLIWLIVVATMLLALLALETTGDKHAPSLVPLSTVANNTSTSGSSSNSTGTPPHCTDGHGKDGVKNKHCQISGSSHG